MWRGRSLTHKRATLDLRTMFWYTYIHTNTAISNRNKSHFLCATRGGNIRPLIAFGEITELLLNINVYEQQQPQTQRSFIDPAATPAPLFWGSTVIILQKQ